jgi:hypothetical protein
MNAQSGDIRHPHLDLENLIAEAAGQPAGDHAREHLAGCERCQREASRWKLVADGVRGLAADAPERARRGRRRRTGLRAPATHWRRALLAGGSTAAAIVLFTGVGEVAGFLHVHLPGSSRQATLTAVTGCSQLRQADGTLARLDGSSLVITTPSGQPVTVTTTTTTFVSVSGPLLGDITNGTEVTVRGSRSGQATEAAIVTVGVQAPGAVDPAGFVPVQGTVADAGHRGFTLVTSSGSRVQVTTSASTLVVIPHARLDQLQAGTAIFAIGQTGPDGTLSATGVAAAAQLRAGPHLGISVRDCSPGSVDLAIGVISTATSDR